MGALRFQDKSEQGSQHASSSNREAPQVSGRLGIKRRTPLREGAPPRRRKEMPSKGLLSMCIHKVLPLRMRVQR